MFAKRLLQKKPSHYSQNGGLKSTDLDLRIAFHYGIPSTASLLAFDPIQRLLAIGTLDGRIKILGGHGVEGLLVSPNGLPYKNLEFLQNQGFLVGITNDNDIQVWSLESQSLACSFQWESNITAFYVIQGSHFMYLGDEHGLVSVIKYEAEDGKLVKLPHHVSVKSIREAAGYPSINEQPVVGVLPQPSSSGNRVLIAFEDGLLILWDVSDGQVLFVGGGKDLQLKDEVVNSPREEDIGHLDDTTEQHQADKEISALCWASSSGCLLAVGYVDGDILFWNVSCGVSAKGRPTSSLNNVVKLQLSSSERRLPVIVLQWSNGPKSRNGCDGRLFIYGGDEIGSEEVLTVLCLEWSSGMETVKCVGRIDLTLTGSFADMILLPGAGATQESKKNDLFVLTSPGQLHFYDNGSLSALLSQQETKPPISALEFPAVIPTADPSITVARLIKLPEELSSAKKLSEVASVVGTGLTQSAASSSPKWPLTGGIPSEVSTTLSTGIKRVYLAGYSDGSVRMWDATYPVLSYICILEGEVRGTKVAGSNAPVSQLDFFSGSLCLAIGNECGLVRVYDLKGCSDGTNFHFVTETKCEVHSLPQGQGPLCRAAFSLLGSPIRALLFSNSGTKLAVGYECDRVGVFDMTSFSVLYFIDSLTSSGSPISSITWKEDAYVHSYFKSPKKAESRVTSQLTEEVIFILTQDAKVNVVEGATGKMISNHPLHLKKERIAISMYVIGSEVLDEKLQAGSSNETPATTEEPISDSDNMPIAKHSHGTENHSSEAVNFGDERNLLVLLCCQDSLRLYTAKSVIQGNKKTIQKHKYAKPCCWTSILKKDGKVCALVSLLQTGEIEIRSLPDLELVDESSLMKILRWNLKANMDRAICSDNNGHVALANSSELAFISLLTRESEFRNSECLPSLHDKVIAAAADAAFRYSSNQKKKKGTAPGIIGGIVKGLKGGKKANADVTTIPSPTFDHLEDAFSKSLLSDSTPSVIDNHEVPELDIDDIEIDEPLPKAAVMSLEERNVEKGKMTERERLLEGATDDDVKPRLRTPAEIIAKYRKAGDAASVAAQARNKLMERQEKLERISQRTAELQSGAEDFASLANELVKAMENRKWWHI